MNAGIYCRISLDRAGSSLGVARQEKDCRKLCAGRGWEVVEVYVDNDTSASSGKPRPQYLRMLEDLKAGRLGAVVAYHNDRLLRSPRELEDFIDAVDAAGATVATVMGGEYDLSTGTGKMSARIVGAVARGEADRMGERIRRKKVELAEAGAPAGGGRRAYGYEKDGRTLIPVEAERVRDAATRVLAGESLRGICTDWNARGVTTAGGSRWRAGNLRRLLIAPRVAGKREHRGEVVGVADWPAILDEVTWARVRALLCDREHLRAPGGPRTYLLSNLTYCALCKSKLIARRQTRPGYSKRSYSCPNSTDGGCGGVRILADWLEDWVTDRMLDRIDETAITPPDDGALDRMLGEVAELEHRRSELAVDYHAERRISRAQFDAADRRLAGKLADTERRIGQVARSQRAPLADLREQWADASFAVKRAAVEQYVTRVEVGPSRFRGRRFDHKRVKIRFFDFKSH